MPSIKDLRDAIARLAAAIERLAPAEPAPPDLMAADAFLWQSNSGGSFRLMPIPRVATLPLRLLRGIEAQQRSLLENTRRFAAGLPANNALLWGAPGTGKSSLVKAVHAAVNAEHPGSLALIEIQRDDIASVPSLLALLRATPRRCLLFYDDLSFEAEDTQYKALKSVLEGGIAGRPDNVLLYATSNRRHLMPREMHENDLQNAIHPGEVTAERVSLSDRFGLWIGFHACSQADYLAMVDTYAAEFDLRQNPATLRAEALAWSAGRGARSGRVAWQFIQSRRRSDG